MTRIQPITRHSLSLTLAALTLTCLMTAQTKPGGQGPGYGQFTVGTDVHHDVSRPLRETTSAPAPPHRRRVSIEAPTGAKGMAADARGAKATPEMVNGGTGAATTPGFFNVAGVGNYFTGPDGSYTPTSTPSDATGAVGATQYLQMVDDSFAVYSKSTGAVLYGPVPINNVWSGFGGPCETDSDGQPTVNFDRMANRWVVSQRAAAAGGPYYQCVGVSVTDDATGDWNRYSFAISDVNAGWENQNAKLGVWTDGYYMGFDMYAGTTFMGPKFCALNRSKMLLGEGAGIQCIQLDTEYYSPVISDVDGATAPPAGAPAYFAADDLGFYALDFWKLHVNWTDAQDSALSFVIMLPQPNYGISCGSPCIPQPNQMDLNPHGSHVLGRMPYRNYGSYQSMVAVENTETVTTPIFYEVRVTSTGDLYMYQEGELQSASPSYRFNPSIAEDRAGNIATAYTSSNLELYPSQYVSSRAPGDAMNTLGNETLLNPGNGSQTTPEWDARASLTLDPVDDCTFYYTEQYQPMDGTDNWSTQIEDFTLAGCYQPLTIGTVPAGLKVTASGSGQSIDVAAPYSGQFPVGSEVTLGTPSVQAGGTGSVFKFASWSDGGADSHNIKMASGGNTYSAIFNLEYELTPEVSPTGSGTVAPGAAAYYLYGSTVNLTTTPAAGYAFSSWTGNVASTTSATTNIAMVAPETVRANFVPLPTTVTEALVTEAGPSSGRIWAFIFTNEGPGQANGVEVSKFALTQTAGTACKPSLISKLPLGVGSLAPGGAIGANVSIDFSTCPSNAVFSLSITNTENGGASTSSQILTGLSQ